MSGFDNESNRDNRGEPHHPWESETEYRKMVAEDAARRAKIDEEATLRDIARTEWYRLSLERDEKYRAESNANYIAMLDLSKRSIEQQDEIILLLKQILFGGKV